MSEETDGTETGTDGGDEHADGDGRAAPSREASADEAAIETMDLDELRAEIEAIDRELVELIAQRTYVADTVARVKAERGLSTTDEQQEAEVMTRASENARRFDIDANLVKAVFRLLIELNKIEQRERR